MPQFIDELDRVIQRLNSGNHPFVGYMGDIGLHGEVCQPLSTHALNYGSSEFEGIKAYRQANGRLAIWLLEEHLDRHFRSMRVARKTPPLTKDAFREMVLDTVALNDDGQVPGLYIRPLSWYSTDADGSGLGVNPVAVPVRIGVMTVPWGAYLRGGKLFVSPRARPTAEMIDGTAKLAALYGGWGVPAKLDAVENKCDEAVFAPHGILLDGTGQEVVIIDEHGMMCVLDGTSNILPSLTKWFLTDGLSNDHANRFPHRKVKQFNLADSRTWKGLALVGTASEVAVMTHLYFPQPDGSLVEQPIGDGQPNQKLLELAGFFPEVTTGQHSEYSELLTPVPNRTETFIAHCRSGTITTKAKRRYTEISASLMPAV